MDSVIDKIKKLLALANCASASDGEASNATSKAHQLLAEYNLSLADIAEKPDDQAKVDSFVESGNQRWKHWVWVAACRLNFCEYVSAALKNNQTKRFVIGRPLNAEAAKLSASYLVEAIERESRKNCKGRGKEYATEYKKGCAMTIANRLNAQLIEAVDGKAQSANGTSLMLRPLYERTQQENEQKLDAMGVTTRKAKKLKYSEALSAGLEAGNSISLVRPIGA